MAGEIQFRGPGTGRTCYVVIHDRNGLPWSTSGGTGAFAAFLSGSWPEYAISASEQGVSNYYVATWPTAIGAGVYNIAAYQQLGAGALQTDPGIATGEEQWNGSVLFPLSDLATSGQIGQLAPIRLAKGVAVSGFPFYLKSSADHITPLTSGVVSGQVSRDGGAFGALQSGAFTEMGLGWYKVNLTSGDLNGTTLALLFTANGVSGGASDPLPFSVITQRVSGQ